MLKTVVAHRPKKFRTTHQAVIGHQVNASLDEMSKAGLLSGLDDCCRTVICDEADMTLADTGLFYSQNTFKPAAEMNCRALIMTLFDRVTHAYIRQLANRTVSVERSKLNILGCSTGDIISSMVIRMKTGLSFDPAIGRFLFWPLDGPVILDEVAPKKVDFDKMASLNQLAIILSFMENIIFQFEEDALHEIVSWGNICKTKSSETRSTDDSLAARLGKSIQHAYRIVTFIQTIEIGFNIYQSYLKTHHHFPQNGAIDVAFIDAVELLFHSNFPHQFASHEPEPFRISKDVTLRAIDLISCNMRQFTLLFDSTNAPKLSSIGRQLVILAPDQQIGAPNNQLLNQHNQLKQNKQSQRYMLNFNDVAASVILFPSICFTLKQLHKSTVIHNRSGGGLLKEVMQHLVTLDILTLCPRGIKHSSRSTSVYIKRIPFENDTDSEENFMSALSEYTFNSKIITMEMYRKSCDMLILDAVGTVQDDVYEILRRTEYGNRDLSVLTFLPKTGSSKCNSSITSIPDTDIDSIAIDDFDFEQVLGGGLMTHSIQQSTPEIHQQQKDSSVSSFVVPDNSQSADGNISLNSLNNEHLPAEINFEDIISQCHTVRKDIQEKEACIQQLSNTSQFDESSSDIAFEHHNHVLNDGFVSPTAWQTRSRVKDLTDITKCPKSVFSNNIETASKISSIIITEHQENACLTNFSSTPPSGRTRARLKRIDKEDSAESKKNGILKRSRKK